MSRYGFTSPAMCREYLHAVTATAAPRRKRRRKPSSIAPAVHFLSLIAASAVALSLFR